ncbi:MAG: glycosyltransferase family 39 protein, partial [Anaerolineae bacterium]|nr:glycosyltransferase family 39 protein [Anaerolineae bacterium]
MKLTRRWEIGILIGLLLAAFALRVLSLDEAPPGLRYDELQNHLMASRVMAGERPLYFSESWGHEPLYHYFQAATLTWFGESDWNLRVPSVFLGVLEVAATWLVARKLFGRRVGLLAAAFLTVSFWGIFYSRIGSRVGSTTLFVALMVYFLWQTTTYRLDQSPRLVQSKWHGWLMALAGGLFMGTAVYLYVAGRVTFGIFAGFVLYLAVFHWREFKQAWARFLLFGVVGVLVAAPLFIELRNQPALEQRLDLLNAPINALKQGDPLPVLDLTARAWGMYVVQGEQDWLYNVSGRPIFDAITAVFFLLGIGFALWRWRRSRYALMLIWLLMGTAPAMLAPPEASLTHTIAAQPVAFILLALGVAWVWRWLDRRQPLLGVAVAVGLFIFFALSSGLAYFGRWSNNTDVRVLYQGGITAVADAITENPSPGAIAIGAPYVNYWQPWNAVNFELAMAENADAVRWFNPAGGWVLPTEAGTISYYFPTDPLGPQQYEPMLQALFLADAEPVPVDGDDFQAYRVANPAAFAEKFEQAGAETAVSWPPELAYLPKTAVPVNFGDRLALQGVEILNPTLHRDEPLRFVTYWQVLQPNPAPLVAFAHLLDDSGTIWAQQDWLDVRVESLQAGDRFVQMHQLQMNPDT